MTEEMQIDEITQAIDDLSYNLNLMKEGRFDLLPILDDEDIVNDELDAKWFSQLEPEDELWKIGIIDQGVQSNYFCCFWHGVHLNIGIVMGLDAAYDSEELFEERRNTLIAACSMALLLLNHEQKGLPFAQNNPEAILTAVCDDTGAEYVIYDGEALVAEGKSWDDLLKPLQDELDGSQEDQVILIP